MCKMLEEMRSKVEMETTRTTVKRLLKMGNYPLKKLLIAQEYRLKKLGAEVIHLV